MAKVPALSFRTVLLIYFAGLVAFVIWIFLSPSEFQLFFGSFLFSIAMAYIAMIRFSRDLQESTSQQIATLREEMGKQLEHLATMTKARAEEVDRLTPVLMLRISEVPYFLMMKDYWVCANLSVPVSELGVKARSVKSGAVSVGNWVEVAKKDPPSRMEVRMAKLGDIGVRRVYTAAEISVNVVTKDSRVLEGGATLSLKQSAWVEVALTPAPKR